MNREEAQFILRAYRVNGEDAHDPQFAEALALVRQDPELARWFAEEQALDAAVAGQLRSFAAPPDLKSQLLLARKTIQPTSWWSHQRAWLAAAASLAVLLGGAGTLFLRERAQPDFVQFRQAMAQASFNLVPHVDAHALEGAELKRWLTERRGEADFVLPTGLTDKRIAGCNVLDWQGRRVTLLCFKPDGKHVDVFVVNEADLPGLALGGAPEFALDGNVTTAAWRRDGKIYVMAGNVSKLELERLL